MKERRAVPRAEPKKPLSARVRAFMPARIVDLSERGLQLELATSLRPEVACDLRIKLDQGDVTVRGLVRRCRAWGFGLDEHDQRVLLYRAGLEFETEPPEEILKLVATVLERPSRKEAPPPPAAKAPAAAAPAPPAARPAPGSGRVKIRISSDKVRKVMDGRGGDGDT